MGRCFLLKGFVLRLGLVVGLGWWFGCSLWSYILIKEKTQTIWSTWKNHQWKTSKNRHTEDTSDEIKFLTCLSAGEISTDRSWMSVLGPLQNLSTSAMGAKKDPSKKQTNSRTDLNFPAQSWLMEGNPARTKWDTVGNPSAKNGRCLNVGNIPIIAQGIEWLARKAKFPQYNWVVSSPVDWVWPPPSNSDQQDYYIFRRYPFNLQFPLKSEGAHPICLTRNPGAPLVTCERGQVKFQGPNSGTAIPIHKNLLKYGKLMRRESHCCGIPRRNPYGQDI